MRCFLSPWPDPRTQPARVSTSSARVDQHSRIEQPLGIQVCLGGLKGSGEQRWALAIVPTPVVAPDRVMVSDCAAICNHRINASAAAASLPILPLDVSTCS